MQRSGVVSDKTNEAYQTLIWEESDLCKETVANETHEIVLQTQAEVLELKELFMKQVWELKELMERLVDQNHRTNIALTKEIALLKKSKSKPKLKKKGGVLNDCTNLEAIEQSNVTVMGLLDSLFNIEVGTEKGLNEVQKKRNKNGPETTFSLNTHEKTKELVLTISADAIEAQSSFF